jgi:hypothetical protein
VTLAEIEANEARLVDVLGRLRLKKADYLRAHPETLRKSGSYVRAEPRSVLVDNAAVAEMVTAARDRQRETARLTKASADRRGNRVVPDTKALIDSFRASRLPAASHPALTWGRS